MTCDANNKVRFADVKSVKGKTKRSKPSLDKELEGRSYQSNLTKKTSIQCLEKNSNERHN